MNKRYDPLKWRLLVGQYFNSLNRSAYTLVTGLKTINFLFFFRCVFYVFYAAVEVSRKICYLDCIFPSL